MRSQAAAGNGGAREGAGTKPKPPSELESERVQAYLSKADKAALNAWLRARNLPEGNAGLKMLILSLIRGE